MPYGGVKDSGNSREGPAYTMDEFTEPRLLALRV
jgi:acyl-CoA reductase-like NAD-dependent aldehyde dehydrogenase